MNNDLYGEINEGIGTGILVTTFIFALATKLLGRKPESEEEAEEAVNQLSDEEKREFGSAPDQTLTQGLFNGSPQEKHLGLVKLPMPNSLADSNNVSWGADQLNALTAAIASGVMGQVGPGISDLSNLITSGGGVGTKFQQLLDLVKDRIGGTFSGIQRSAEELRNTDESGYNNLAVLGSSVVGSALNDDLALYLKLVINL